MRYLDSFTLNFRPNASYTLRFQHLIPNDVATGQSFPSQFTAPPTRYTVSIIIDGNPVDLSEGIPAVAHTITSKGSLPQKALGKTLN